MKKISFFALFMLLSLGIEAQVKVVSPHPDIKVKFLRCIESGGNAVIEFTVNNLSNQDKEFNLSSCCGYSTSYDDEGNLYEDANIQISDRIGPAISIVFPSNIPVKCKLHIEKIQPNSLKQLWDSSLEENINLSNSLISPLYVID